MKKSQKITREDIDRLVIIADSDPVFRERLRELDQLANRRGLQLYEVIETAVALYDMKNHGKELNKNSAF